MRARAQPRPLSESEAEALRSQLDAQLAAVRAADAAGGGARAAAGAALWRAVEAVAAPTARELAEALRLVLEPTHATRLRGDYRTGKRLNMRKARGRTPQPPCPAQPARARARRLPAPR